MPGNLELLVLVLFVGYYLWVSLLYATTAHILLFRKRSEKPTFWKNFKVYLGIVIIAGVLRGVVNVLLSYYAFIDIITFVSYIETILMLLSAIVIGLLASRWIRYDEKTSIGFVDSFKVVGTVLVLSLTFNTLMQYFVSQ